MRSSETSTLSEVKLRSEVVISRTSRSKTISSIGRRSYETIAESMIARMPEFSLSVMSARLKPRRLSISSWFRMRSAPPLLLAPGRTVRRPRSSPPIGRPCRRCLPPPPPSRRRRRRPAPASRRPSASRPARRAPGPIRLRDRLGLRPCWFVRRALLDDDFLEQHGVDLARRDRDVDAPRQLLAHAIESGRAFEVALTHLAQIGLERVH